MKSYIKYICFIGAIFIVSGLFVIDIRNEAKNVMEYVPVTDKVIILDAGHGGIDPGSLNADESIKEKDVNLEITLKLKKLLESSGALVFLTREEDVSLHEEEAGKTTRQKYNENLKNRKQMIKDINADMFISIHLNKFEDSKYYGAQTFYPTNNPNSQSLANFVQTELKRVVDETNNREIKPADDLYLLKDNEISSILIECGFLSNQKESQLLLDGDYQDKLAWAIFVGIQQYFTKIDA